MEKSVLSGNSVGKINYFEKVKDTSDILVFGSSRALHHINTEVFGKLAFNVGADGKRIAHSAALMTTLKRKNQILLVHIDHNRVFDQNMEGDDALSLLYKRSDQKPLSIFFYNNFRLDYFTSIIIRSYAFNGKVFTTLKSFFVNDSINKTGFEPIIPSEAQKLVFKEMLKTDKNQRINISIKKPLIQSSIFEKYVDIIKRIANENDSKLIFFTSPSLNKVDSEVSESVHMFFKEKGLTYIDHIDYFKEFDISLWKDYTHLSSKGANIYTKKMINEIGLK